MGEKRGPYGSSDALDEAGEEEIFSRVAEGEYMGRIATSYGVGRTTLYRWIDATPERQAEYEKARRISADVAAEESSQVLEDAAAEGDSLTTAQAGIARSRSENSKWLASIRNREKYASSPQVEIGFNFPGLHVSALRQNDALPGGRVQDADYELVENGEPDVAALLREAG